MDKELSEPNFAYEIGLHLGELKNRGFDSRPRLKWFVLSSILSSRSPAVAKVRIK
jgi:hypothetical protein